MNRLTGLRWRDPLKGLLPKPSERLTSVPPFTLPLCLPEMVPSFYFVVATIVQVFFQSLLKYSILAGKQDFREILFLC